MVKGRSRPRLRVVGRAGAGSQLPGTRAQRKRRDHYRREFTGPRVRPPSYRRYPVSIWYWLREAYWFTRLLISAVPIVVIFIAMMMSIIERASLAGGSEWTTEEKALHWAAAPNCAAARAVGLAPAYRGQPGYYPRHDRDRDGIACEPYP